MPYYWEHKTKELLCNCCIIRYIYRMKEKQMKLRPTNQKQYRSAKTGKFVKEGFANVNPDITYLDDLSNVLNDILNKLDQEIETWPENSQGRKALVNFGNAIEQ